MKHNRNMDKSDVIRHVERAMAHDEKAIEALYKDTFPRAWALVCQLCRDRQNAEDILQESYIAAFNGLHNLDNHGNFWQWLRGIILNKWRDFCKDKSLNYDTTTIDMAENSLEDWQLVSSAHDIVEQSLTNDALRSLIAQLPPHQSICILLYYYENMKIEEIAEELGIPEGSVKSRLHYGREKLRKLIEQNGLHGAAILSPTAGGAAAEGMLSAILAALAPASGNAAAAAGVAAGGTLLTRILLGLLAAGVTAGLASAVLRLPEPEPAALSPVTTATTAATHPSVPPSSTTVTTTATSAPVTSTEPPTTTTTTAPPPVVSFDYSVQGDGAVITKYTGNAANVDIPASVDGYPVIEVGEGAFRYNRDLRSVSVPGSVQTIGANAFRECPHLHTLYLEDGVGSVGNMAFCGCGALTEVSVPGSVQEIGIYAFAYCAGLQSVEIGYGVQTIGYGAFYGCDALSEVELPETVVSVGRDALP